MFLCFYILGITIPLTNIFQSGSNHQPATKMMYSLELMLHSAKYEEITRWGCIQQTRGWKVQGCKQANGEQIDCICASNCMYCTCIYRWRYGKYIQLMSKCSVHMWYCMISHLSRVEAIFGILSLAMNSKVRRSMAA